MSVLTTTEKGNYDTLLTTALKKDGSVAATADLPMGTHKFTGLSQGNAGGDSMRIDDNSLQYQVEVKEDWDNGGITGTRAWVTVVSGTGAAVTAVTTATSDKNVGVVQLARGTVAGNRAGLFLGATVATWTIGANGNTRELWLFQIPTLSDGTNTFRCVLGRGDTSAAGDQVNGVYIVVDTTVTTKIQLCSAAASTRTLVAGTFDVAGATWVLAAIKKSDGGTTHGLEVWTGGAWVDQGISISTNIPTATLDILCKLDGSVGTTSRTMLVDFVHHRTTFPTGRA